MALEKVALLLVLGISYYITVTPPNPPPSSQEMSKYPPGDRLSGGPTRRWVVGTNLFFLVLICEIVVNLSSHFADSSTFAKTTLGILLRTSSTQGEHVLAITPIFVSGFFLCLCGTYVRWSSYRALGRLYTYEASIRDRHQLITWGPYGFVRHPGYIGLIGTCTGTMLCLFCRGSWLTECGWLELLAGKIFAGIAIALHISVIYKLLARMSTEDMMMQKEFGAKWDEWVKTVPYKLVPGVF